MAGVWVGVDLGGTNAKAAAISDDGVVLASHAISHDGDLEPDSVIRRLHQCAEASLEDRKCMGKRLQLKTVAQLPARNFRWAHLAQSEPA